MGGTRRRQRYGGQCWCAVTTAVLLLVSISFLYSRLASDPLPDPSSLSDDPEDPPLLLDSDPTPTRSSDDRIDELDLAEDDASPNEEEILRSLDSESSDDSHTSSSSSSSSFFFDHSSLLIRHSFDRRSIDDLDPWDGDGDGANPLFTLAQDPSKLAVASDDVPVDEDLRRKMVQVSAVEDALLLKSNSPSPLRQGWGPWFDAKTDFLRKDKMFKSSLELLNPLNNVLLQDPDTFGATPLTRGDKLLLKAHISRIKKAPSLPNAHSDGVNHTTFGRGVLILQHPKHDVDVAADNQQISKYKQSVAKMEDGAQRWGHFPGLPPYLSFSNFMDSFFRKSKCSIRIFMVWNSPSWMFTTRHQRGLESVLYHHPNACLVIFSETIELDFFKDFVKDRYSPSFFSLCFRPTIRFNPVDCRGFCFFG